MDRRQDRHYQANFEVRVTDVEDRDRVASGQILDISHEGLCANLTLELRTGSNVKVQAGDCELFGKVTDCTPGRSFQTNIEVLRVEIGESDLSRLLNAVLAETMPATPGVRSKVT